MEQPIFKNRAEAAQQLSSLLTKYKNTSSIVLGIPRGGVVTASVIAKKLSLPLGLLIVRKIGHPNNREYAVGAISESGIVIHNDEEINDGGVNWFHEESQLQLKEAKRRRIKYWGKRYPLHLKDKTVILVDDGLATGITMEVAIKELESKDPSKIVVAVPVSPRDTADRIKSKVDEFISPIVPDYFAGSVGAYYENFPQVDDDEVIKLINNSYN